MKGDGDGDGVGLGMAEANSPMVQPLRGRDLLGVVVQQQFGFAPLITNHFNICPVHIANTRAQGFAHRFFHSKAASQAGDTPLAVGLFLGGEEPVQKPLPMPGNPTLHPFKFNHVYPCSYHRVTGQPP